MSRVYDDPNHPYYGPARRCWVILVGLFSDLTALDESYQQEGGWAWDEHLAYDLTNGVEERRALRKIVWRCLDGCPQH